MARGGIGAAPAGAGGGMEFARARRQNALDMLRLRRDSAVPVSAAAHTPEARTAAHRPAAQSSAAASPRAALPPRFDRLRAGAAASGAARTARRSPSIIASRSTTWPSVLWTVSSEFLGAAVGFRLAETDVRQFALDRVDDVGVHRLRRASCGCCCRRSRPDWRAAAREGAGCPAARPRRGRDCRHRDPARRSPAVPEDTSRAVRDGRMPMRCRCRPGCGRAVRTGCAARPR